MIFREKNLEFMVTSVERSQNHLIDSVDTEMGSTILFTDGDQDSCHFHIVAFMPTREELGGMWDMDFDGPSCRGGAR